MKTRGLLTLGVAALAGLSLAVLTARSGGTEPPSAPVPAIASKTRPGASSTRAVVLAQAAMADHHDRAVSDTSPASAPSAAAIAEAPEPDDAAVPAAPATASAPPPLAATRAFDLTPTGGEPNGPSITIKQDAVIGVRLDRAITTETARVDDRVTARVARDVLVDDRPALAAGTCVQGYVAMIERGPRSADRVRLGLKFTTIALADDRRVPLQAETIFRENDPDDAAGTTSGRSALNAFLAGAITRPAPARAQPVPPTFPGRDLRIPAGSLLTIKLTAPVIIEK